MDVSRPSKRWRRGVYFKEYAVQHRRRDGEMLHYEQKCDVTSPLMT
jgi:hypothetical protein